MTDYCLSFISQPREGWKEVVEQPKAPSNYKDQVKIDAYVEDRWLKLEADAHLHAVAGEVVHVGALGIERAKDTIAAVFTPEEFLAFIFRMPPGRRLFAVNIRLHCTQLSYSALRSGGSFPFASLFPPLGAPQVAIDPMISSITIESAVRALPRELHGDITDELQVRLTKGCKRVEQIGRSYGYF